MQRGLEKPAFPLVLGRLQASQAPGGGPRRTAALAGRAVGSITGPAGCAGWETRVGAPAPLLPPSAAAQRSPRSGSAQPLNLLLPSPPAPAPWRTASLVYARDAERNAGLPLDYVPRPRRCGPELGTLVVDLCGGRLTLLRSCSSPLDAANRKRRPLPTRVRRQAWPSVFRKLPLGSDIGQPALSGSWGRRRGSVSALPPGAGAEQCAAEPAFAE